MSINDTNRFLYEHAGTLQSERLERAPSPGSMKVSDRTFEDLIKRSAEFAKKLYFYNDENERDGDWQPFFERIYDYDKGCVKTAALKQMMDSASVPPHLALMLAFFKLVLIEQDSINTLTDRQMAFYFEDILGFRKRESREGGVTVFAQLNKNTKSISIDKGALFDAGKDEDGKMIVYEAEDESVIGREEVDTILTDDGSSVKVVLPGKLDFDPSFALCITSPILSHPVCKRIISLKCSEESSLLDVLSSFHAQYSSQDGWTDLVYADSSWTADADMPEMVPPVPGIHGKCPSSSFPVIRFVSPAGLGKLSEIDCAEIEGIFMIVKDWVPVTLFGKFGPFENKPGVNPFGTSNRQGDYFDVMFDHPASSVESSDPFETSVKYEKVSGPTSTSVSYIRYELSSDDNSQEVLSNKYSNAILRWMKNSKSSSLDSVINSNLIAVTPKLTSQLVITAAEFSDTHPLVSLQHPFGSGDWAEFNETVADYKQKGPASTVYLALSGIDTDSSQANILWTLDTLDTLNPAQITWEFFDGAAWKPFPKASIMKDSTIGLSRSGITQIHLTDVVSGSVISDGYFWIRGICNNGNAIKILSAQSRAIDLVYSPSSPGKGPQGSALPAGSISKPVFSIPGLKAVVQQENGKEGLLKENDALFHARVSEQLRHKGRAWSPWDYETLILERFPNIVFARCLPACSASGETAPGEVTVQVIAQNSSDSLHPSITANQIVEIKEMLAGVTSPFIKVNVQSPLYLEIKVSATVILRSGYNDTSKYESRINAALNEFLRPWIGLSGSGQHFSIGDSVADILAFLEAMPYVDHVEVPITVWYNRNRRGLDDQIELPSPLHMITSAESHDITCKLAQ